MQQIVSWLVKAEIEHREVEIGSGVGIPKTLQCFKSLWRRAVRGGGGGQVVSVRAVYYNDLSFNLGADVMKKFQSCIAMLRYGQSL